jgi:hypothetical protein
MRAKESKRLRIRVRRVKVVEARGGDGTEEFG